MRSIFFTLVLFFSTPVYAEVDYPSVGITYENGNASSISYDCNLVSDDVLNCKFIQTRLRKEEKLKTNEEIGLEVQELFKISKEDAGLDEGTLAGMCSSTKVIIEALAGKRNIDLIAKEAFQQGVITDSKHFVDSINEMSEAEKGAIIKQSQGILGLCDAVTPASVAKFFKMNNERAARTCNISSIAFNQSFRYVSGMKQGQGSWVVIDNPSGSCGIINLSRFEQSDSMWDYYSKKSVTNPKGMLFSDVACGELDEDEYLYSWRPDDYYVECDIVKFKPL